MSPTDESDPAPDGEQVRIFLSYRRDDGAGWTAKLFEALEEHFGEGSVFKDDEAISAGDDFETRITHHLDRSTAVVAVIGKHWAGWSGRWWRRSRLARKGDWVRRELERAGESTATIFPVLVDGAALPTASTLPTTLVYLIGLQATELRPSRWDDDVAEFLRQVRRSLDAPPPDTESITRKRSAAATGHRRGRRSRRAAYVAVLLAVAVATASALLPDSPAPPPSNACLVDRSTASDSTLDIGFWNLERFVFRGPGARPERMPERIARVADALVRMDLDACGLLEVDEEALNALIAELAQRGLSFGYVFQKGLAGFNLALLYRRDRVLCSRADDLYSEHASRLAEDDPATGSRALPRVPLFVYCTSSKLKRQLLITVVHFKSMYGGVAATRSRRQHASVIVGEIVSGHGSAVVGGTFHALPDEAIAGFGGLSEVGGLTRLFEPESAPDTFIGSPEFNGMIDYIWASHSIPIRPVGGCAVAVVALDRSEENYTELISDHRPIMTSVEFDQ